MVSHMFITQPRIREDGVVDRAQGVLLGQVIGDSLGSQVEFQMAQEITRAFPNGVRELVDGGVWNLLAGQPTDDSELALALARSLVEVGSHDPDSVATAYANWFLSQPFDMGNTTAQALSAAAQAMTKPAAAARRAANITSQANGALMRVSPLGVWAAGRSEIAANTARQDALLTHPHPVCQEANAAYVAAIAVGVAGADCDAMTQAAMAVLAPSPEGGVIGETIRAALNGEKPRSYQSHMGWVLIALQNAFYHLHHSPDFETALVETVGEGGDTDTNGAIVGALMGAALGRSGIPNRWVLPVLSCRPGQREGVAHPRPQIYWPDDILDLTEELLRQGGDSHPVE